MSVRHDQLLDLERSFWTGDRAFFNEHADRECLVAFPEMAGTMANADLANTAIDPPRWRDLEIELKGIIEPQPVIEPMWRGNGLSSKGSSSSIAIAY